MSNRLTRVMMVEDDADIRAVAHLSLTAIGGFDVELCPSGAVALARLAAFAPQMILLDVMMPGMDGPATLGNLKRLANLEAIPVVFLTGQAQPAEVSALLALGAADVLTKPFDPMTLPATLQKIWDRCHG